MTTLSTEQAVTWSEEVRADLILQDATLSATIEAVLEATERLERGEGIEIDPDNLPTDDE